MKKVWFVRLVGILIILLLMLDLPFNNIYASDKKDGEGKGENGDIYTWREGESWDRSCLNGDADDEWLIDSYPMSSDGNCAKNDFSSSGDSVEFDFTVFENDTYYFYCRCLKYSNCTTGVRLKWNDEIIGTNNTYGLSPSWTWFEFGQKYLSEGIGTLRVETTSYRYLHLDKILITNNASFEPWGKEDGQGSNSHFIGQIPEIGEIIDLNYSYIKIKTENLSNVIFNVDWPNLEKGRAFGTTGEHEARDDIKNWMKNELSLFKSGWYYKEQIKANNTLYNLDFLYGLDNKLDVDDMWISFYNKSSSEVISLEEFFISPQWNLEWNCSENEIYTGEFTYPNITIEMLPSDISEWLDFFRDRCDYINDNEFNGFVDFMDWTIEEFEEEYIEFSNLTPSNAPNIFGDWWNETYIENLSSCYCDRGCDCSEFVFIGENPTHNPNMTNLFPNISVENLPLVEYALNILLKAIFVNGLNCKGLLYYDFNNYTYDMNLLLHSPLPTLYIKKSVGEKINISRDNYNISFYISQDWNSSIVSHNVIGQIYGTDPSKTIIVCCLYDSWWNQGTADSAIGMSIVLGIAKWFKENRVVPKYNIKFIAFAGEEYGLCGAYHYEKTHRDEDIVAFIDLNQLGFRQNSTWSGRDLTLYVYTNNNSIVPNLMEITNRSNYEERLNDNTTLSVVNFTEYNKTSDYTAFHKAINKNKRPFFNIIGFLKDTNWTLHHRDGLNHTTGDVLEYYYDDDVNVTAEMILNVIRYYAGVPEVMSLYNGWNMVTIPVETDLYASDFAENTTNCTSISRWDAINQTYDTYIVGGPPTFDFEIEPGMGYFIDVTSSSVLSWTGNIIMNTSYKYNKTGWNLIGWYKGSNIMASELVDEINNSGILLPNQSVNSISKWDATNQTYYTYIVGGPPTFNFTITRGMALFVDIYQSGKGGGKGSSPGLPHTIWGYSTYKYSNIHADNANVTILNENTSEEIYTIVGLLSSGWYREELGRLPSGWSDGHIINVTINSTDTDIYKDWTGYKVITANDSLGNQKIDDILLSDDSKVYRDDNGTEEDKVTLDESSDEVLKTFYVDSMTLSVADSAKLWVYAKADGEHSKNDSHILKMNNDSNATIYFNPIDTFGYENCWQSFSISLDWLSSGYNNCSIVDAFTEKEVNDLIVSVDTENDNDRSQWKVDSEESLPPASECEGELLMVLQLFY